MIIATSCPNKFKIGAELIKWYQGGTKYSHILIIKDDLVFQASHGLVHSAHIDNFLHDNVIIDFYEINDNLIDIDFVHRQLGKKYGFLQLFVIPIVKLIKLKWEGNGDQRFICSEFVGKALKLDWVDDQTTPKDIDDFIRGNYGNS